MAVAALAAIATLLVAPPAAAASVLDPPAPSDALDPGRLPPCTDVGTLSASLLLPAAGLGWRASTVGAFVNGTSASAVTPIIPCRTGTVGNYFINLITLQTSLVNTPTAQPIVGLANVSAYMTCMNGSGVVQPESSFAVFSPTTVKNSEPGALQAVANVAVKQCSFLVSARVVIQTFTSPVQTRVSAVWKPSFWTTSDSHYKVPLTPSDIPSPFDGLELPVNCAFAPTGTDMFTLIGSFFATLVSTTVCLFTPVGWDRSAKITGAWQGSPLGAFADAMTAVMPSSLGCGVVATIPVWGSNVVLDTCAGDIAPGFVKVGVSWLLVLACGVASVKRILWAVGSG